MRIKWTPSPKASHLLPVGKNTFKKHQLVKKTPYRETPIFENSENHLRKTQS